MNKNIFIFMIPMMILMSAIVIADSGQELGTFKLNDCINLKVTCANCTFVNITSINRVGNIYPLLGQVSMTKQGTEYNYTFCNNSALGQYNIYDKGDSDGILTTSDFKYFITTTGTNKGDNLPLFLSIGAVILLIIAIYTKNLYFSFISGVIFLISGIYMMIYGLESIADFYTRAFAYIEIGLGIIFTLASAYELIENEGYDGSNSSDDDEE